MDVSALETPCFVCDLGALERNARLLADVERRAGCRILLALKGFAQWSTFPLLRQYLTGVAASSVAEARLGREEFGKEVHAYSPAYSEADLEQLLEIADLIVFNSFSQWRRLRTRARAHGDRVRFGIRVNPEHSEVKTTLYDPCAPYSRLGVTLQRFEPDELEGVSGLHFHTLCQLGADALERTLEAFEHRFGRWLSRMRWVNFGGGHHITREGYDVDLLVNLIRDFRARHGVEVYLEPGEAVGLNAGVLVTRILDIIEDRLNIAILDTSAAAHMPDVLAMPYRPQIVGAGLPGEYPYTYRLGGLTCLAGDVIGDYSFAEPLQSGQRLVLLDMAIYSMVKNTTFNGIRLPSIANYDPKIGRIEVVRRYGYEDYKHRLS
jgi:carboxynorspermidine decarboxylase